MFGRATIRLGIGPHSSKGFDYHVAPPYLSDDCQLVVTSRCRQLRSSHNFKCAVISTSPHSRDWAFAAAGPCLWNSLPTRPSAWVVLECFLPETENVFNLIFSAVTLLVGWQEGHPACRKWGDGGGGHCLVRMEWRPAGWSVCLPVLIFPCIIVQKFSSGTGSPRWS